MKGRCSDNNPLHWVCSRVINGPAGGVIDFSKPPDRASRKFGQALPGISRILLLTFASPIGDTDSRRPPPGITFIADHAMNLDRLKKYRNSICVMLVCAAWIACCVTLFHRQARSLDAVYDAYAKVGAPDVRYPPSVFVSPPGREKVDLETWLQANPTPPGVSPERWREANEKQIRAENASIDREQNGFTILTAQKQAYESLWELCYKLALIPLLAMSFLSDYFSPAGWPQSSVDSSPVPSGCCPQCRHRFHHADLVTKARRVNTFACPSCHSRLSCRVGMSLPGFVASMFFLVLLALIPWHNNWHVLVLWGGILAFQYATLFVLPFSRVYVYLAKPLHDSAEPADNPSPNPAEPNP
ncbi:MAG: hypothetical protein WC058_00515 [Phycisphaeraceae bacterium]